MCLGRYAYAPFKKANDVYIRMTHRGEPNYVAAVKVKAANVGYIYDFVSPAMPRTCVNELAGTLQRNMSFLMRWGLEV